MSSAVDEFGADEKIASGAVELAEGRIDTGSDGATNGTARIPGHEKGEELFVFVESGIQFHQGDSNFCADGEVAGIVMGDFVKGSHVQCDVVARGGHADGELGAIAAGNEGEFFESSEANDFGDFFGRGGFCYDGGDKFIYGVVGARGRI